MSTVLERESDAPSAAARRPVPRALIALVVVALVVLAAAVGWAVGHRSSSSVASPSAVDVGFAQDMSTHHTQAVTMAGYERDNTTDPKLRVLAYDIETEQQFQLGEMGGWLVAWNRPTTSSTPMSWMGGHMAMTGSSLMPGMATPAQMTTLESSHGTSLDVLFLKLMIRHHQGALGMARYALAHAATTYVRRIAGAMLAAQSSEIIQMEQLLRQRGGTPLPAPTS